MGTIRLAHLDAIARIVPHRIRGERCDATWEALEESVNDIANAARGTDISPFEQFCDRVRDRLDDGAPGRVHEPSRVWLSQTFQGRWALKGDLSADDGAALAALLEERTRRLPHSAGPETSPDPSPADDRPPMSEARAAALHALCIAGAEVRPVFCDSGRPLTFGRSHRLAPDILRRVLQHRDRDCCVPGCTSPPAGHDAHHLQHWEHGGTTDPANMIGCCGPHHRGHHQGRWRIDATSLRGSGEATVRRRDATVIEAAPHWARSARRHDRVRRLILDRLRDSRPPPG